METGVLDGRDGCAAWRETPAQGGPREPSPHGWRHRRSNARGAAAGRPIAGNGIALKAMSIDGASDDSNGQ